MKTINIYSGNNTFMLFEKSIENIKNYLDDFSKQNIVIVPDKLSLITEQKIFEILNISTYFNLSVMGISKFANKIIKENGLDFFECTAFQAKLLTLKAIQNTKENFKCFSKNYSFGFVDEIYSKIEQIKSSNANIEDLIDDNASKGTKLKYEDLRLIYNEYEKIRGDRIDSGSLLSLFNNICSSSALLKTCNVFFIGFDSLTKQGLNVLSNVAINANYCFISVLSPIQQPNYNIYDTTFLNSILDICALHNTDYKITQIDCTLSNNDKNIIQNNLFSRKNKFNNCSFVNTYSCNTIKDEIDFVIKSINYNIKNNGYNFKDIGICCQLDNMEIIKSKLNSLGISTYTDEKTLLSTTEPIKYIISFLKSIIEPYNKSHIISFILNDFCELEIEEKNDLINLLNQFSSLKLIKQYNKINSQKIASFINNYFSQINLFTATNNYIESLQAFIKNNNIFEKIINSSLEFKKLNEIALEKIYLQIEDKLTNTLQQIEQILNINSLNLESFCEILFKSLDECEINGIPSTTNQVFIGDIKSFYHNIKLLYILEVNDGFFPPFLANTGLISDKEINSETIKAVLEPTTKIINKRNKYKALDILLSAKEKCYISYHKLSGDGKMEQPSEFITELSYLFNLKEINVASLTEIDFDNVNSLCFNSIDKYNANLLVSTSLENNSTIKSALKKCNFLYIKPLQKNNIIDFKQLFIKNGKLSISLIEKFNSCPKSAFLANGICLKKNKKEKIEANVIGSFIHEVAEKFIKLNLKQLGNLTNNTISTSVMQICDELKEEESYYSIFLDKNKFVYNIIKNECIRFCSFLNYEQTITEFKPIYTEKYFGDKSNFKPLILTVDGEQYKISGIVDRIDYCDDSFRIIDYKSGNPNFKNLKNGLFYGTKLQLFIYAEAINQNINKNFFGAFYLPVQNKFDKNDDVSNYKYTGFILNSISLAQKCDRNFNLETRESKLFEFKLNKPNKKGELNFRKNDNILSKEELTSFNKYANKIISSTIKNLKDGYIECSPIDEHCKHCEFAQICGFANEKNKDRSQKYDLTNQTFLELNYE